MKVKTYAVKDSSDRQTGRIRKIVFYFLAITGCFCVYSLIQERLMTVPFGIENEYFKYSVFVVFINRIVTVAVSSLALVWLNSPVEPGAPVGLFGIPAIANVVGSTAQYEALKHVSFPLQALAKCAKTVPVMLWNLVTRTRSYSSSDIYSALTVTAGCGVFVLTGDITAPDIEGFQSKSTAIGLFLLAIFMIFDGLTSTSQDKLFASYDMHSCNQLLYIAIWSAFVSSGYLFASGQLHPALHFIMRHPSALWLILSQSVVSTTVQLFIVFTIKQYGALNFALIMTVRQFLSIVISCLVFQHDLTLLQWCGTILVILGLVGKSYSKQLSAGVHELKIAASPKYSQLVINVTSPSGKWSAAAASKSSNSLHSTPRSAKSLSCGVCRGSLQRPRVVNKVGFGQRGIELITRNALHIDVVHTMKEVLKKFVKAPLEPTGTSITKLSVADSTAIAIATSRATFWTKKFDAVALERTLVLLAEDLPFLAGRLAPLKLPLGWKMGDLAMSNNNEGIEFTVISLEEKTLAECGPDNWTMQKVTISAPKVPVYIPAMDTGYKMLKGKEPVCKVQLTQLADGDVLAMTLSHTLTDGIHWPALMTHFAARYRQVVTGKECDTAELLPSDGKKSSLSLEYIKDKIEGGKTWKPNPFPISATLCDYWRAFLLLVNNARKKVNFNIVYISRQQLASLKARVQENRPQYAQVTTGYVVQALAALMVHGAEGKPLLPVQPQCMVALVQIPGVDKDYFGNAVHPMGVGIPSDVKLPPEEDSLEVLRVLAGRLRECTIDVRTKPGKALQALYETEVICAEPVHKALAFLAGNRLPFVTCTTNYIGNLPTDSTLDFGLGVQQHSVQWLVTPLARDMCVIRAAATPYEEGLFFHMALTAEQSQKLRELKLIKDLVPDAVFVGNDVPSIDVREERCSTSTSGEEVRRIGDNAV